MNDYYAAWRAMEELYEAGRARAIGVCNFDPDRLTDRCLNARVAPMVDQVELHPFFAQGGAIENMKTLGVQAEAWGPLAEGKMCIRDSARSAQRIFFMAVPPKGRCCTGACEGARTPVSYTHLDVYKRQVPTPV